MEKKTVGLLVVLLSALAVYLVQHPRFTSEQLRGHLQDKVIVICGASSGIGEQIAYKYAATGAKLILSARSVDKLNTVKNNCSSLGASSVHIIPQDFSKIEEIESFRNKVLEIHPEIDVLLLNHAAIPLGPWTSLPNQQDPTFVARAFNINVLSFIELTRLFLPELESSSGQIQVTGSISGWCPFFHAGLYTSTKYALNGFFYSLQQELLAKQSPVSVTVFSLGLIMTRDMDTLLSSEPAADNIPDILKGNVQECAEIIASSTLVRPRSVDYPIASVKFSRMLAYLLPNYNELVASAGMSYEETVRTHLRISKLGDTINYQVGNK